MPSPEENFETVVDDSNDEDARERAINVLETANECDRLAQVVRNDGIEDELRERALDGLAHPQCTSTLEALVEEQALDGSLHDRAERLLEDTPDDAGPP